MYVDHYTYYFPLHRPRQLRLQILYVRLGFLGQAAMQFSRVSGHCPPHVILQFLHARLGFLGQAAMQFCSVPGQEPPDTTPDPPEPLEERSFREILFYLPVSCFSATYLNSCGFLLPKAILLDVEA